MSRQVRRDLPRFEGNSFYFFNRNSARRKFQRALFVFYNSKSIIRIINYMVFYILIFLCFAVCLFLFFKRFPLYWWDIFFFSTLFTIIFSMVLSITILLYSSFLETRLITRQTANIKSIKTESSINGSFFLGSGGFGHNKKYYSYTQYGPGYILQDFPADSVIVESNSVAPNASWDLVSPKSRSWLYPDWLLPYPKYRNYQITVPEGTIISEYKLN